MINWYRVVKQTSMHYFVRPSVRYGSLLTVWLMTLLKAALLKILIVFPIFIWNICLSDEGRKNLITPMFSWWCLLVGWLDGRLPVIIYLKGGYIHFFLSIYIYCIIYFIYLSSISIVLFTLILYLSFYLRISIVIIYLYTLYLSFYLRISIVLFPQILYLSFYLRISNP